MLARGSQSQGELPLSLANTTVRPLPRCAASTLAPGILCQPPFAEQPATISAGALADGVAGRGLVAAEEQAGRASSARTASGATRDLILGQYSARFRPVRGSGLEVRSSRSRSQSHQAMVSLTRIMP